MKLYFYFLETPYNGGPFIRLEECEVIEKAKTYYPKEKFLGRFYGSYVKKSDIGHLSGYHSDTVILTEQDNDADTALDLLEAKVQTECKRLETELEAAREKLRAIENFRI